MVSFLPFLPSFPSFLPSFLPSIHLSIHPSTIFLIHSIIHLSRVQTIIQLTINFSMHRSHLIYSSPILATNSIHTFIDPFINLIYPCICQAIQRIHLTTHILYNTSIHCVPMKFLEYPFKHQIFKKCP